MGSSRMLQATFARPKHRDSLCKKKYAESNKISSYVEVLHGREGTLRMIFYFHNGHSLAAATCVENKIPPRQTGLLHTKGATRPAEDESRAQI